MSSGESPESAPARASSPDAAPRPTQPALAVAAVARRLGVAPSTLRTWDRRYGLGPSEHSAGSHRRYSAADVARLLVMRQLTISGVAPVDAARSARESDPALAGSGQVGRGPRGGGGDGDGDRGAVRTTPSHVVEAALRDDEPACRRFLSTHTHDVETWWTELVEPARASLASRTVLARAGEDPVWLLESAALAALRARTLPPAVRVDVGERVVLLFAAPGERRPLALHVLAASLTDRGVDARIVTGPVEQHRIVELVTMTSPIAVVVLSELAAPDLAVVRDLGAADPELNLFVGLATDEHAQGLPLGRSVHWARSFLGLLHEVLAVSAAR